MCVCVHVCFPLCFCVCVCAQISAISTLRCRCKMLPPWRGPGCCAAFCLLLKQLLPGTPGSTAPVDSPVSTQHVLPAPPALCYSNVACLCPSVSVHFSALSAKSEGCSSGTFRRTPGIFFFLSLFLSLSRSFPPLPSPSSAQVKALAVWR